MGDRAELNFDPQSDSITRARRRLLAAYERRPGAAVPVVEPGVGPCLLSVKENVEDLDRMLDTAVAWANALAATADVNDWTPVILGYCTVVMVPEAFGCEVVFLPGQSPWAKHAIGDIAKVWHLKPVRIGESPMIRRNLDYIDHVQRKLGTAVPMWTPDIQCPFSIAAQIVEPEELLAACITNPKAVHHLCGMITDYVIELTQTWLARIEHPGFPGANFPCVEENIGLCMADDTPLIMLGPAMYEEFALPYNSRVGEAVGGLHIHSCGDYRHNLDSLLKVANVRSIQVHAGPGEFPLPATADADDPFNRARRKVAMFIDVNDVARGGSYAGHYREHYAEYVLPRLSAAPMTGCIVQSCGTAPDASLDEVRSALRWTREQINGRTCA